MSSQIEKIEVSPETAQLIRARAEEQRVSVDDYLKSVARMGAAEPQAEMSLAEIDQILDELAAGDENLPPLPENFSREEITAVAPATVK